MPSIPLAINATFLLSGMLGLQLQLPDGTGKMQRIQTSVPFSMPRGNTTMIMAMDPITLPIFKNEDEDVHMLQEEKSCKNCDPVEEVCVTWKNNETNKETQDCLPSDGLFSTKSNPKSIKLCPEGKTHSLIQEPLPCLKESPPCDLKWNYNCVNEAASPHNCTLRKCPKDYICMELIHCNREPPCLTLVECHHISNVDTNHYFKG